MTRDELENATWAKNLDALMNLGLRAATASAVSCMQAAAPLPASR